MSQKAERERIIREEARDKVSEGLCRIRSECQKILKVISNMEVQPTWFIRREHICKKILTNKPIKEAE